MARIMPLVASIDEARTRSFSGNKIFHGQVTPLGLSRDQLLKNVADIRLWCNNLATSATRELGCDGFVRNSFRKSPLPNLAIRLRVRIESVNEYGVFIRNHMEH